MKRQRKLKIILLKLYVNELWKNGLLPEETMRYLEHNHDKLIDEFLNKEFTGKGQEIIRG